MPARPHVPPPASPSLSTPPAIPALWLAVALSMGAAISLGITRFAYALLLPPMREDLGWSYTLAGAMNTVNALGYLLGALATPLLLRRLAPGTVLVAGSVLATLFMGLSGFFTEAAPLLLQRLLAGVASALVFVAGGLLAARLGAHQPGRGGLLLGLYYGGTGWGITLSAVLVPSVLAAAPAPHAWTWAWWALGLACAAATLVLWWPARALQVLAPPAPPPTAFNAAPPPARVRWRALGARAAGLRLVWGGLHRLHDLCGGAAARTGRQRYGRDVVLCAAGAGGGAVIARLGRPAGPQPGRAGAGAAQRPAGRGHGAARTSRRPGR